MSNPYVRHNKQSKANFDGVYDLPDPRGYFAALGSLGYEGPEHGRRIFSMLLRALGRYDEPLKLVDLCCSYGVNAALLKHDLTLRDLFDRYASPDLAGLSAEELADSDAAFYASHRKKGSSPQVVGVDVASNAVSYALRAGLLDAGSVENLEKDEPTEALRQSARGACLVTVTGGVGYIWERTFDRVLSCIMDGPEDVEPGVRNVPWVAAFAVRFADYAQIASVLERRGLVTEKLPVRTFPQRRFENDVERDHVLRQLAAAGIDPSGKEESGWYHADFYLSRPFAEAAELPLEELLGSSGALDYQGPPR